MFLQRDWLPYVNTWVSVRLRDYLRHPEAGGEGTAGFCSVARGRVSRSAGKHASGSRLTYCCAVKLNTSTMDPLPSTAAVVASPAAPRQHRPLDSRVVAHAPVWAS